MGRPKKKNLLIVEADERLANIYARRFEEAGWRVVVSHKFAQADKSLARHVPDAVLIDPPEDGGMAFLRALRADPKTASIVQLILTDAGGREVLSSRVGAGVDAYLLKSYVTPNEVVRKTKQLLDMNTQKASEPRDANERGFSLVELLIVIAVIALIAIFAAVAVSAARSKQRDATRISSVRLTQSALEDYFNQHNAYPAGALIPLGDASQSACLGSGGFAADCSAESSTFLRVVPGTYEDGLKGLVTCGEPARRAVCYSQRQDGVSYVLYFELENTFEPVGLKSGVNCATPDGMKAGVCKE